MRNADKLKLTNSVVFPCMIIQGNQHSSGSRKSESMTVDINC